MQIFRSFKIPEIFFNSVLAIGNFDGVHIGHQEVINKAKIISRNKNLKLGVLTFEPHPKCFFRKEYEFFRLTPFRLKFELLRKMKVDFIVSINFNSNFVKISAEQFIEKYLVKLLKINHVVTGFDFVFGNKQKGNVNLMKKISEKSKKFEFTEIPELKKDKFEISSSQTRFFLRNGKLDKVNKILSRDWSIVSRVIQGDKRARKFGFNTANLKVNNFCNLLRGVYMVEVFLLQSNIKKYLGIANYGIKPTFHKTNPILEVHIFNFKKDIYGKRLRINFLKFIREEKKFESVEKLKDQIIKDIKVIKDDKFFKNY